MVDPTAPVLRTKRGRAGAILRRGCQVSVYLFIVYTGLGGAFRNFKVAHNHRRLVGLMEGEFWATLYGWNEDMLSWFSEPYAASKSMLGFPWSARLFGLDTADPLLVAGYVVKNQELPLSLLLSAAIPLGLALILGKVFCSHLCPMRLVFEWTQALSLGLARLGVEWPTFRVGMRLGHWVLLGGLLASGIAGLAVWHLLLPYVALSQGLFEFVATGTVSVLWWVVFGLVVLDLIMPGFFCHSLCPSGALLEKVGAKSRLQLTKHGEHGCPRGCEACETTCPYHLSPRERTHRPACDSCGRCVRACPQGRLSRKLVVLGGAVLGVMVVVPQARAHHNKGLPHYGYFENYPQVPTEEYVTIQGKWEFGATIFNFQGMDRSNADTPNDVKIYCYLYDLEADQAFVGAVDFELKYEGRIVSKFERVQVDEEAVYSTRETLPESGEYHLVAVIHGQRVVLPFYADLTSDGIRWGVLAGLFAPVLLLLGLALHGRRRRRKRGRRLRVLAVAALLACLPPASEVGAQDRHAAEGESSGERASELCPHCGMVGCEMDHGGEVARAGGAKIGGAGQEVCPHCGMVGCTMEHYETPQGSVMVMSGIPLWLFLSAVAGLIVLTFFATEWLAPRATVGFRVNLIGHRKVYALMRSRWLQPAAQLLAIVGLGVLIYFGLFGSRVRNVTPIAVWTLWWGGLIFLVLVLGSAWCFLCPWDGLANLVSRWTFSKRTEGLSLGLPYPDWAKNMYPAIALFVVLTWLELGYGVTTDPRTTAYMGLGMAALAVCAALLWHGKKFCAHMCPVGRICGIYANFSPFELRAKKARTCEKCRTEDCLKGNREGYPCPTGISLKTMQGATHCTLCTECIKSCDKQNVALNLRPFGADLRAPVAIPRQDEAWMAVMLLSLTLFHGLSMTPAWENFAPGGFSILKWLSTTLGTPRWVNFSLAMLVVTAVPVAMYWAACWFSARWAQNGVRARTLFASYSFSLLPVALFYHLAHNLMHVLMEGGEVVPLLSDPMGRGDDWFGTASVHVGSLVSDGALWVMQVGLILVGHVYGIRVAHGIGHRLYRDPRAARRSLATVPVMMIAISVCGLWLMHMDMNMRTGRM